MSLTMCIWIIRSTPASNLRHTELIASVYLDIIRSANGLSPDRCQAIFWKRNADVLSMKSLGKNFNEAILFQEKYICKSSLLSVGHVVQG